MYPMWNGLCTLVSNFPIQVSKNYCWVRGKTFKLFKFIIDFGLCIFSAISTQSNMLDLPTSISIVNSPIISLQKEYILCQMHSKICEDINHTSARVSQAPQRILSITFVLSSLKHIQVSHQYETMFHISPLFCVFPQL